MIELYRSGQSIYDIAPQIGCAPQTVHKQLVKAGEPRRDKTKSGRLIERAARGAAKREAHATAVQENKDRWAAERAETISRYQQGESASAIGRALGRPTITISNWLKAAGVERRTLSEACRKHTLNERAFETIETDAQAYWLGFLTADGGISDRDELRVNLQLRDKEHLERLRAFLDASCEVKEAHIVKPTYERHCAYFDVLSHPLCADLRRHGIAPRKSQSCRFNNDLTEHLYGAYIRGLFDGDGGWSSLTSSQAQWHLKGNEEFLLEAQAKMIQLVGVGKTKLGNHHSTPWLKNLCYSGIPQALKITRWMYAGATVFLPRKIAVLVEFLDRYEPSHDYSFLKELLAGEPSYAYFPYNLK